MPPKGSKLTKKPPPTVKVRYCEVFNSWRVSPDDLQPLALKYVETHEGSILKIVSAPEGMQLGELEMSCPKTMLLREFIRRGGVLIAVPKNEAHAHARRYWRQLTFLVGIRINPLLVVRIRIRYWWFTLRSPLMSLARFFFFFGLLTKEVMDHPQFVGQVKMKLHEFDFLERLELMIRPNSPSLKPTDAFTNCMEFVYQPADLNKNGFFWRRVMQIKVHDKLEVPTPQIVIQVEANEIKNVKSMNAAELCETEKDEVDENKSEHLIESGSQDRVAALEKRLLAQEKRLVAQGKRLLAQEEKQREQEENQRKQKENQRKQEERSKTQQSKMDSKFNKQKNKVKALEDAFKCVGEEVKKVKQRQQGLNNKIKELSEEVKKLKEELEEEKSETASLQGQINRLKSEKRALEFRVASLARHQVIVDQLSREAGEIFVRKLLEKFPQVAAEWITKNKPDWGIEWDNRFRGSVDSEWWNNLIDNHSMELSEMGVSDSVLRTTKFGRETLQERGSTAAHTFTEPKEFYARIVCEAIREKESLKKIFRHIFGEEAVNVHVTEMVCFSCPKHCSK